MRNPKRASYEKAWREKNRERYLQKKREYYEKNKEEIRAQMREYYSRVRKKKRLENPKETKRKDREAGLKRIAKLRKLIQDLKVEKGGKCVRCGYSDEPRILQFHHINGRDKLGNISEMKSQKKIREESKKCELLCPNCHSLEHLP